MGYSERATGERAQRGGRPRSHKPVSAVAAHPFLPVSLSSVRLSVFVCFVVFCVSRLPLSLLFSPHTCPTTPPHPHHPENKKGTKPCRFICPECHWEQLTHSGHSAKG